MTTNRQPTAAELWFRRGLELAQSGNYDAALEPLEQALAYTVDEPEAAFGRLLRSYYGLTVALSRGDVLRGRRLCEEAIAGGPVRSDLYVNLARVYLRAARRNLAIEALVTALSVAPNDRDAWTLMAQLGLRRPPVVSFLSRGNPINRYLGLARHRLLGSTPAPLA
ncbi:MAG: tetratricopeptide repeat protein [Acidobacteria bacterium]|nr:tetratricopeptide repeat protein [Acidobacteriota bacterium]